MPRPAQIVCLLLCVSFLLAPFSTLHAHPGSDHDHPDYAVLHGGHVHEVHNHANDGGDIPDAGHTVDVNFAIADRGKAGFSWTDWLPLICMLAVAWLIVRYSTFILRPLDPDGRPLFRLSYWRPPLRGPPLRSI